MVPADDDLKLLAQSFRFVNLYGFDVPTPITITFSTPVADPAGLLSQEPAFTWVSGDGTVSIPFVPCACFAAHQRAPPPHLCYSGEHDRVAQATALCGSHCKVCMCAFVC
jgi:hypothetical protein